jgi:hypothetical protein
MKIAPLKVSDPWYGRILNNGKIQAETLHSVPIESTVEIELVELLHGGPESNYRPYLHLRGELTEAKPAVELPYGVTELAMRRGAGLSVDAFYDFNPRQLSDLVSKGYFTEEFQVPSEMSGIPWTLPGTADFLVVAPEFSDQPPVVFMSVHDQSELGLDEANSGYDLSAYFPDYNPQAQEQVAKAQVIDAPERGGSGLDVFSDIDFDAHEPIAGVAPARAADALEQRGSVPAGVFSQLVAEIEAQRVLATEPDWEPEPEQDVIVPGSPEDVYLSRVSPGVEHVLSSEQFEVEIAAAAAELAAVAEAEAENTEAVTETDPVYAAVTEGGFLDLSEPEPELSPLPVSTAESVADAHRQAANRRTTRIRTELTEDEGPAVGEDVQPGL